MKGERLLIPDHMRQDILYCRKFTKGIKESTKALPEQEKQSGDQV